MDVRILSQSDDRARYTAWLSAHPQATLWQSLEWQSFQQALGRETRLYVAEEQGHILASALVVIDRTAFQWSTWDLPRGPLWSQTESAALSLLLGTIVRDARKDRCLSLYLSPTTPLSLHRPRLSLSPRHEQPEATRILDLTLSDELILSQMHQKGRYNIRVAQKHGIVVEESANVDAFHALMRETAIRDRFAVAPKGHYDTFLKHLPNSFLLLAYASDAARTQTHDSPIAGLMGVTWGATGYYYYGASDYEHRALMAPYLLQWEAMQRCKAIGCTRYDLLGCAPPGADEDHPWQGITGFKEKFGGELTTYPPEQFRRLKPLSWSVLRCKRWMLG
jgi:lipid II:glycine glycyltransferase (peptidoglycan interpeptide bridge formation enzyme)